MIGGRATLMMMTAAAAAAVAAPSGLSPATAAPGTTLRAAGPAGSLLLVESHHAVPIVHVVIASRTGAARDPKGKEGLTNLGVELARRGAAGKSRAEIDAALDALGATLDGYADQDSVRLQGHVLARNLDAFLTIVADVVLRPDFTPDELARTQRELIAAVDEIRNDDRALAARFFRRRVYGDHPYGRPASGTETSLRRPNLTRKEVADHFRAHFSGMNLIFAVAGDVAADDLARKLAAVFGKLPKGTPPRQPVIRAPAAHDGWRIQLVDKPSRQQTQILFGHPTLPASHPDFTALAVAMASFGGHGMKATLMDEVRTKRGLSYGAYMDVHSARGPGLIQGWVFPAADKTVATLKLVLNLFQDFAQKAITQERLTFVQGFLVGSYASEMDSPKRRLEARVGAEIDALPADFVDTYVQRVRGVTTAEIAAALKKHADPDNLAITMVATAATMKPLLLKSKIKDGAIDVVPFDSF